MNSVNCLFHSNTSDPYKRLAKDASSASTSGFAAFIQQDSSAQESVSSNTEGEPAAYDFSSMTRGEIANAGKDLFARGEITLDELFRFGHPDGISRLGTNGEFSLPNSNEQIDFLAETRNAIQDMEATGESQSPTSSYEMMLKLLAKLES